MYELNAEIIGLCVLGVMAILAVGISKWLKGLTSRGSRIAVYIIAAILAMLAAYLVGISILGTIS